MKIVFLYGTETGNSEMLTEELAGDLKREHDVSVRNMRDASPETLADDAFYIVISSTYGDGELPASAQNFGTALRERKPDLSGMNFAIFGLGDSQYVDTFGAGSQYFEDTLLSLGAREIGEREVHDISGAELPEKHARRWLTTVLDQYRALVPTG